MRWFQSVVLALVSQTMLAAIIGGAFYAFAARYGRVLPPVQVVGVALMFATPIAIPPAFMTNLAILLVSEYIGSKVIGWATIFLVALICVMTFPIYMAALAPVINWNRAMLLPLATVLAAMILWMIRRFNAAKRGLV